MSGHIEFGDRVEFTGKVGSGLDTVFADAEKSLQAFYDEQHEMVGFSLFVRHPLYPKCTGYISWTPVVFGFRPPDPLSRHWPKREIVDDGLTPSKRIAELARYLVLGRDIIVEERRGGPEATPEEDRLRIVRGWEEKKGRMLQEVYAGMHGIDATTLRRWRRDLRNEGKLG